jgi:hypothetical protein
MLVGLLSSPFGMFCYYLLNGSCRHEEMMNVKLMGDDSDMGWYVAVVILMVLLGYSRSNYLSI